jgi:hypothetical protein
MGNNFEQLLSYYIEIAQNASDFSNPTQVATVPSNEFQNVYAYILTNLTKGQTYYARVLAINSVGLGSFSSASSGSVAADIPAMPDITSVGSGIFSGTNYLTASWTPPLDTGIGAAGTIPITYYLVQISNGPNFVSPLVSQIVQPPSLVATLRSDSLFKGVNYFVRVFAVTSVGSSESSAVFQRLLVNAPSPPSSINLVVSGPLQLSLSWQAPADTGAGVGVAYPLRAFTIQLFVGTSSWSFEAPNTTFSYNITNFNGTKLVKGYTYYASISASNDADGGSSNVAQSPPRTAIDLSSQPATILLCSYDSWIYSGAGECSPTGPLSLLLTWAKPSDSGAGVGITSAESTVLTYEVVLSSDYSFSSIFISSKIEAGAAQPVSLSYTFTGLSRSVLYWARVRAFTSIGAGVYAVSDGKFSVTTPGYPIIRSIRSKMISNDYFISLQWSMPQDTGSNYSNITCVIISYLVTVSSDTPSTSGNFSELVTMFSLPLQVKVTAQPGNVDYITTYPVQKGTSYSVSVQARNSVGLGQSSESKRILITGYPGQPTQVTLSVIGPLNLLIGWSFPSDLGAGQGVPYQNINVEYMQWSWALGSSATSFPTFGQWQAIAGSFNATSYALTNVTKGLVYRVAVRVVNLASGDQSLQSTGTGGGLWIEDNSAGVVAISVPSVPLNFSFSPFGNGSLLTQWKYPKDTGAGTSSLDILNELGFEIQICEEGNCALTQTFSISRAKTAFQVSSMLNKSLVIGTVFEARIRAINLAGASLWSSKSQASPLYLPGAPTNISTALGGETSGLVVIYVGFSPPSQTGLGPQSTLALLTSVQVQSVPVTASSISCNTPQPVTSTSIHSAGSMLAMTGLSKVFFCFCEIYRP